MRLSCSARLLAADDVAHVHGEVHEELRLELVEGLSAVRAQQHRKAPRAHGLAQVEKGADARLPQLAQHDGELGLRRYRDHGDAVDLMGRREGAQAHRELAGAIQGQLRDDEAVVAPLAHPDERGVELVGDLVQDVVQVLEVPSSAPAVAASSRSSRSSVSNEASWSARWDLSAVKALASWTER